MRNSIKPKPKSVLSLDIGIKRIGLAGCDPLGITITKLPALHRKNFKSDIKYLQDICLLRSVKALIIGLPLDDRGESTKQSIYCKNYGSKVVNNLGLPVAWINENSTTWQASVKYNLKKDRSGELDSAAAVLLLEQWLEEGPEAAPVETTL